MNAKGTVVFVGIMVAFVVIVMGVIFVEPLKDQVSSARVSLNCSAAGLSTGEEMTCISVDSVLFLFIGTVFAVGVGWIGARKIGIGGSGE